MFWPEDARRTLEKHAEVMQHTYRVARASRFEFPWYAYASEALHYLAYRRSDEHNKIYVGPQIALPGQAIDADSAAYIERISYAKRGKGRSNGARMTRGAMLDLQAAEENLRAAGVAGRQSTNTDAAVISALEQSLSNLRLTSANEGESQNAAGPSVAQQSIRAAEDIIDGDETVIITHDNQRLHCRVPDFIVYVIISPDDDTNHKPVKKILFLVELKAFPDVPDGNERNAVWKVMKAMSRQAAEQAWYALQVDEDMPTVRHLSLCGHWYLMREFVRDKFENGGYNDALESGRLEKLEKTQKSETNVRQMCDPGFTNDYDSELKKKWTSALKDIRKQVEALWGQGRG